MRHTALHDAGGIFVSHQCLIRSFVLAHVVLQPSLGCRLRRSHAFSKHREIANRTTVNRLQLLFVEKEAVKYRWVQQVCASQGSLDFARRGHPEHRFIEMLVNQRHQEAHGRAIGRLAEIGDALRQASAIHADRHGSGAANRDMQSFRISVSLIVNRTFLR